MFLVGTEWFELVSRVEAAYIERMKESEQVG